MNDDSPAGDIPPTSRPNRFGTSDGSNPFSEDDSSDAVSENPFASPLGPSSRPQNTSNYVAILPHRGIAVLSLGIAGFVGVTIGSLGLICCLPFPLFALAVSVPAWLMGRMDLKAMNVGAMDGSGRGTTTIGYWLGLSATVLAVLICLGYVAWFLSLNIGTITIH